jgi:hypothetical protein
LIEVWDHFKDICNCVMFIGMGKIKDKSKKTKGLILFSDISSSGLLIY